mgnify:CR=1 FL=1
MLKMEKGVTTVIIAVCSFLLPYSLCALFHMPSICGLFAETRQCLWKIYFENSQYLWTGIFLSVEVYIFTFILTKIIKHELFRISSREERVIAARPVKPNLLLMLPLIVLIYALRDLHSYAALREKSLKYLCSMVCFLLGILLSLAIIVLYELAQPLMWLLFVFSLTAICLLIMSISRVSLLPADFDISIKKSSIIVKNRSAELELEVNAIFLGLSVLSGMAGIITTVAAVLMRAPLIFSLIPATFDMISLLTALMELTELEIISSMISSGRAIAVGLAVVIPMISWSIYLGGFISSILKIMTPAAPENLVLMLLVGIWVLIAVILGAEVEKLKYSVRSIMMLLTLSIIPLLLAI